MTADDASVLFVLASTQIRPGSLSVATRDELVATLRGEARKVAEVIVGTARNPSRDAMDTALAFLRAVTEE